MSLEDRAREYSVRVYKALIRGDEGRPLSLEDLIITYVEAATEERERCASMVDRAALVWAGPSAEHGNKARYVTDRVARAYCSLAAAIRADPLKGESDGK